MMANCSLNFSCSKWPNKTNDRSTASIRQYANIKNNTPICANLWNRVLPKYYYFIMLTLRFLEGGSKFKTRLEREIYCLHEHQGISEYHQRPRNLIQNYTIIIESYKSYENTFGLSSDGSKKKNIVSRIIWMERQM